MIKLNQEGLLVVVPQSGTFISKISLSNISEGHFVRCIIEEKVVKLAIQKMDISYIKKCESILDADKELDNSFHKEHLNYDELFHKMIYKACDKHRTWSIIRLMDTDYYRIRFLALQEFSKSQKVIQEHEQILQAIIDKDEEAVVLATKSHLNQLDSEKSTILKKYSEYFEDN